MLRLVLDNRSTDYEQTDSEKLGDLLRALSNNLPPNRVITEILLDGIQIPKHRQREEFSRTLQRVQELQIRTADATLLATNGLDSAVSTVSRLQQSLLKAAELFRESNKGEANRCFYRCIEGLERFLETILVTRNVMRLDFDRIHVDGVCLAKIEKEFTAILDSIVNYQEKSDYENVAEIIECALLTNLSAWQTALAQLRRSSFSNA